MPQTTGAVPQSCARIDISTAVDCSAWTDISGSANSISGTEQSKMVAEEYTFDGDYALVEPGKIEPFDLVIRIVFTPSATEAYRIARDAFKDDPCNEKVCIRWIPSGIVGGDGFQTNSAPIINFQWPPVSAATAGPVMTQFTVRVSEIDPFIFVS